MKSILQEAIDIRGGERKTDYGDAVENFDRIAEIYQVLTGKFLSADDCCAVMIAVKLSRERHAHKRDNLVDLCGYADILNLIRERDLSIENSEPVDRMALDIELERKYKKRSPVL